MSAHCVRKTQWFVLSLLCLCIYCNADTNALPKHHKMEKHIPRSSFVQKGKSSGSEIHKLVFSVHQKNLDILQQRLKESSTPGSPKYLQWMTFEEVGKLSSNPASAHEISKWLHDNGATIVSTTKHMDYITATAPIETWEKLLDTEFYEWEDQTVQIKSDSRRPMHRAKEYSIPVELKEHVNCVFNTVQTPPPFKPKYHRRVPFKSNLRIHTEAASDVNIAYLDELYHINSNTGSSALSQSVFETSTEYFSPNDLSSFQNWYDLPAQAAVDYNGHSTTNCASNSCTEGNLDIQYIMGIAQSTVSIFWYTPYTSGSDDPFVTWITDVADESNPPQSNSISWGVVEAYESASVMNSFNTEAMKLANMGVTIAVSSGDDGAPNAYDYCLCSGVTDYGITSNGYNPSFPASCPYVTAVGGTMGPNTGGAEVVCQSDNDGVITSGGGFSDHFTALDWQTDAVNAYFDTVSTSPVSGYNRDGRAYPDISFIAVDYQVWIQTGLVSVYGTSCSAPVFAGMVSLVNAARHNASLTSIGFLNPTLYTVGMNTSSPYTFNDVTSGNNKCCAQDQSGDVTCCGTGFLAAAGWDPATGWGSMNYDTLSAIYAVATPYVVDEDDSGGGGKSGLSTAIVVLVVLIVLCVGFGVIFAAYHWCCKGRRGGRYGAPSQAHVPTVVEASHHQHTEFVQLTPVYVQQHGTRA